MFNLHPQTLRLYEREGLLTPSRSEGNTRLYGDEYLKRLEVILNLIRDLGVNLAGVEVILNMRHKMEQIDEDVNALLDYIRTKIFQGRAIERSMQCVCFQRRNTFLYRTKVHCSYHIVLHLSQKIID